MRKLAIALALVLTTVGFASTASAQGRHGHNGHRGGVDVYVGGGGIGVHVGHGGVDVRVGTYRGNPRWDGGYRNGGYRNGGHWGGDYRRYPHHDVYGYPNYRGGRYYYEDRYYDYAPSTITVQVWEYRQVWTRYGWEDVRVRVYVTAYWDSYFGAYVYRDSYGRQHVID